MKYKKPELYSFGYNAKQGDCTTGTSPGECMCNTGNDAGTGCNSGNRPTSNCTTGNQVSKKAFCETGNGESSCMHGMTNFFE